MRKYLDINLSSQQISTKELNGAELAVAGRYFIAKTLVENDLANVDPLGPDNPLIFSAGPFAGTNFSNANRLSVGAKSPLTGGIKESNSGGTFAFALGQLGIFGFTLHGASDEWVVIHIPKEGEVTFTSAEPYMGKGNIEVAQMLHEKYGKKVSLGICGPVGEYQGLVAGISFSDDENRPVRLAARGGIGAVMGSKRVKAIVVDKAKMPPLKDRKKVMSGVKEYNRLLGESEPVQALSTHGTAMVGDLTNTLGGLPVRNFTAGAVDTEGGPLMVGGNYIHDLNTQRGGTVSHACMPGCMIKCSNIYADEEGNDLVSPLEYETIGLMGTNCGLTHPDDIARVNAVANDLGIDTIETGAMMAVLMDSGEGKFGDVEFMLQVLEDIREGNERGRILSRGTARVGEHYGVKRVPVIKKQAISAYDPRVVEVTGVSMMFTAQGADHTTGNLPSFQCEGKSVQELVEASFRAQVNSAVADSLGLCVFGRSVTDTNLQLIANAINGAFDADIEPAFFERMGRETLILEKRFNREAGFSEADDELPAFFSNEPLAPSNKVARLTSAEINEHMQNEHQRH